MKYCKYCDIENYNHRFECERCGKRLGLIISKIPLYISLIHTVGWLLFAVAAMLKELLTVGTEYALAEYGLFFFIGIYFFWFIGVPCSVYQIIYAVYHFRRYKFELTILQTIALILYFIGYLFGLYCMFFKIPSGYFP